MFEIIVEIGGAHKGDTNYLEELISDAIQAGSTHIKFQISKKQKWKSTIKERSGSSSVS